VIDHVAYIAMHTSPLATPGKGDAGGMNVYLHELALTMASRGVDVVVFTRRAHPDQEEVVHVQEGYRVVHLPAGVPGPVPVEGLVPFVGAFADEIITWIERHAETFDVIHSHYWLSGWVGAIVKEVLKIPMANSFHTLGKVKDLRRHPTEAGSSPIRLLTEAEVIEAADCVIASTAHEFDDLLTHYHASPERLCVSPPGIDHTVFAPGDPCEARRRLGFGTEPLMLFVGRLQRHKGPEIAVETAALVAEALPETQLVVVGGPSGKDGRETEATLRRLVADRGLGEQVRFVAPVPHHQLVDWYRAADLLLMPSRSETFGLVAAEAQACGLPVVAARVGGLRDIIEDARSGILIDGHDPRRFATAALAILDNPSFRATLSAEAIEHSRRFSWPQTADRLLELYAGITAAARP